MAILDCYYELNRRMADPKTADENVGRDRRQVQLAGVEDMKTVVQQTRSIQTPEAPSKLLEGEKFQKMTMPSVAAFVNRTESSRKNLR